MTVLGILMGAASLISLLQRWSGVEIINEMAGDALSLYRQMMLAIHWAVIDWWTPLELPWGMTLNVPMWFMDVIAIWVICVAAQLRAQRYLLTAFVKNTLDDYPGWRWNRVDTAFGLAVAPYGFARDVAEAVALIGKGAKRFVSSQREDLKQIGWSGVTSGFRRLRWMLTPVIATAAFFLWNAVLLSPEG
jgi:hypothetical protein